MTHEDGVTDLPWARGAWQRMARAAHEVTAANQVAATVYRKACMDIEQMRKIRLLAAGLIVFGLGFWVRSVPSGSDGSKASDKQCADWAYAIQGANSSDPTRRLHALGATGAEAQANYDRYCR
jgi:hypothetical protein